MFIEHAVIGYGSRYQPYSHYGKFLKPTNICCDPMLFRLHIPEQTLLVEPLQGFPSSYLGDEGNPHFNALGAWVTRLGGENKNFHFIPHLSIATQWDTICSRILDYI